MAMCRDVLSPRLTASASHEGAEPRAEERALGEFCVERQVVRIHRPLEALPAAVEEHVAEVSHRVAEPTAPVDDPRETTSR